MIDRTTAKRDRNLAKTREARESGGRPLQQPARELFESRFGHNFAKVRVHADERAAGSARALGARAFTVGSHIFFGNGQRDPETSAGLPTLAHELTHVVQNERDAQNSAKLPELGDPEHAFEREADRAKERFETGAAIAVRERPGALIARDAAPVPGATTNPQPPPLSMRVFDDPSAWTAAGAPAAFDKYIALAPTTKAFARSSGFASGGLSKALQALGPSNSEDPKYADTVHDILRWIEETTTRKATGMSDPAMATTQASSGLIKTKTAPGAPPNWGGAAVSRWVGLLPAAQTTWKDRGNKAIAAMVTYAGAQAPELKLTAATFELDFDALDKDSLGAMAAGGSVAGTTVLVGFEFVVTVEVNPAYALSTVVHELKGHPMYEKGTSYQGQLYQKAAAQVPGDVERTGEQTYDYWPSEIYSLMKEIPYWTAVTPADTAKSLNLPGSTTTAAQTNYDPRTEIGDTLGKIKTFWAPSLVNGILHGFFQRVSNDPSIKPVSLAEFAKIVRSKFSATDADAISK